MLTRKTSKELALYQAAAKGCVEEVRALLAAAPDVGALLPSTQISKREYYGIGAYNVSETPLMAALYNVHEDVAHTLLDAGEEFGLEMKAHFPSSTEYVRVPICECVGSSGLCSVALRLLKAGGNHYGRIFSIVSALEFAIQNNRVELCSGSLLACAVEHGHLPIINILLEAGADVHYTDQNQNNMLMKAVWSQASETDRVKILRLLLEAGVDINSPSRYFELTPLMEAARIEDGVKVLRELIAAGADVFMRGYIELNYCMQ